MFSKCSREEALECVFVLADRVEHAECNPYTTKDDEYYLYYVEHAELVAELRHQTECAWYTLYCMYPAYYKQGPWFE